MTVQTKLVSICAQMGLETSGADRPEPVPCLIVGAPGVAKTELLAGIAASIEKATNAAFPLETMALPQIAPENISGIPVPDREKKQADMYVLSVGKKLIAAGRGILFLDEFSSASDQVAASSLTLVQSGMLGDTKLPASVARILAMNDPERATAGRPLMAPESNRMCWVDWNLECEDWCDYMKGGLGALKDIVILPNDWEKNNYFPAASLVTSFMRSSPGMLLKEPDPHKAGCAWPSPRSWRNATRLLAACMSLKAKVTDDLTCKAINGCVGEGAAGHFLQYANKLDLPDPEEVLAKGTKYKLPERDDRALCILESVTHAACLDHPDKKARWETAAEILEKASTTKSDICLGVINMLLLRKPEGVKIPKCAGVLFRQLSDMGLLKK